MIELQPLASRAAMAGIAHERAPAPIALPYSALDCGGDMPGVARRGCGLARPRLRSRRKLAFLELADERVERPVQHLDDVARRNLMAEQVLRWGDSGFTFGRCSIGDGTSGTGGASSSSESCSPELTIGRTANRSC